jgi:hypothetical protein
MPWRLKQEGGGRRRLELASERGPFAVGRSIVVLERRVMRIGGMQRAAIYRARVAGSAIAFAATEPKWQTEKLHHHGQD